MGRAADAGRSPKEILEEIRRVAKPGAAPAAARAFEEAVALLERGRDAAAVAPALEAKTLAPRSGAVREVLGLALYRTGRFGDALGELQAYRRITGRVDHNHLIADCYRAAGAPGKALPLVQEALRARIPEDARAEAAIVGASALADMGRTEAALSMLRAFPARPDSGRASDLRIWYVTGDVLARAGRTAEAVEEFRRVLRHDPGAFDTAERLAALGS
jgi:tetratricopeptide (TPR) repeat protein